MSLTTAAISIWVLTVVAWYVVRYPFARRARKRAVVRTRRGTAESVRLAISLTGLGIIPGLYAATRFPASFDYQPSVIQVALGTLAAIGAVVLFRLTHKALGKMWSVSLDIREEHKLVTEGIYRHVRHPMYSAFWLMALAQALLIPNLLAGLAGLVGFGILFAWRLGDEERMMEATFGEEYRAYSARTARIIPGIF